MLTRLYRVFLAILVSLLWPYMALNPVFAQEPVFEGPHEDIVDQLEGWELQKNDWLLADVKRNLLQFVREDDSEKSVKIRIGSGINNGKKITYLGMTYNPATPEGEWEIRSKNQQNVWSIFGSKEAKEQLFLRMYRVDGEKRIRTMYGIHTTPNIDAIIKNGGFGSYGCLITKYELLKQIEQLYEMNEGVLKVKTVRG